MGTAHGRAEVEGVAPLTGPWMRGLPAVCIVSVRVCQIQKAAQPGGPEPSVRKKLPASHSKAGAAGVALALLISATSGCVPEQGYRELSPQPSHASVLTGHICAFGAGVGVCTHLHIFRGESLPGAMAEA